MRNVIVAVCVAAFATAIGASASAQSSAEGRQEAAPEIEAELERLRSELEQARARLEAAARDLAISAVPARGAFVLGSGDAVLFGGRTSAPRAKLGVALVDAEGGALVTEVVPDSGASDAGIEVGDLIQSIDDIDLSAESSPYAKVLERLAEVEPGDSVTLAVETAGEVFEYDVETAESQADLIHVLSDRAGGVRRIRIDEGFEVYDDDSNFNFVRLQSFATPPWGEMELVPMTSELASYFGTDEGLLVIRGPSDDSIGIEDGDVMLAIGGRMPNSPEHAIRILATFEPGETIEFSIMREGDPATIEYVVP